MEAIEKVDEAKWAKDAALEDSQDIATTLLYAEAKLGELLAGMELLGRGGGDTRPGCTDATRLKDLGIEKTESHRAQLLAWGLFPGIKSK